MRSKRTAGILLALLLLGGLLVLHTDRLLGDAAPQTAVDTTQVYIELDSLKDVRAHLIRLGARRLPPVPPEAIDTETLWLARVIYSETKRPEEMELVAWVVRNRVETQYRGKTTYRDVVLDPFQFSAFIPYNPRRHYYLRLTPHSRAPGWQQALSIAYYVRFADTTHRPFSIRTRHFYSEQSMTGRLLPVWAEGVHPIRPMRYQVDERRFRFYEDIS